MAPSAELNRRERILDAAESAFANAGFDGASLRRIVQAAGVNLATVYYHFGSKEGLMAAVFHRRFGALRQEHLGLLKQLEQEFGDQPLPVEKLIETMLIPPLRLAAGSAAKCPMIMRLIGRIVTDPNPQTQELLRGLFTDVRKAFLAAFARSLPDLPPADLLWRYELVWGALAFILCNPRKIEKESHGLCNPLDAKMVIGQMVIFFAPGFRAPANPTIPVT